MINIDYLAGFFDGEGCVHFSLCKSNRSSLGIRVRVGVTIAQKNPEILYAIRDFLGLGAIYEDKGYYRFVINSVKQTRAFINLIIDKVYLKREELLLAKQALDLLPNPGVKRNSEQILEILKTIARYRSLVNRKQSSHYDLNKIIEDLNKNAVNKNHVKLHLEDYRFKH